MSKRRTVYPVAGLFLTGIPHAPVIADGPVASQLVASGAFQSSPADDGEQPEAVELSDEQAGLLPFFHNVETETPELPETVEESPAP